MSGKFLVKSSLCAGVVLALGCAGFSQKSFYKTFEEELQSVDTQMNWQGEALDVHFEPDIWHSRRWWMSRVTVDFPSGMSVQCTQKHDAKARYVPRDGDDAVWRDYAFQGIRPGENFDVYADFNNDLRKVCVKGTHAGRKAHDELYIRLRLNQ